MLRRVVTLGLALTLAVGARAEEARVVKARLKLDQVERKLSAQPPGDVGAANALIAEINKAVDHLKNATQKGDPAFQAQAKRAQAFDAQVRERLGGAGQPVAADQYAKQGAAEVAKVEAGFPAMAAGDVPAANKLVQALNAAKQTLSRSNTRASREWMEAAKKANELDAKIRARAAEKASGGTPSRAAPAKAAPAAAPRLGTDDNYKFRRDFGDRFPGYQRELEQMDPRKLAADHVVRGKKETAAKMRAALRGLSAAAQSHPKLVEAYAQLDAYEKRLDELAAEGKRLQGEAAAAASAATAQAEAELAAIRAKYDPDTFDCDLDPPWSPGRVEQWAKDLRAAEARVEAVRAELEAFGAKYPGFTKDPKYSGLVGRLKRREPAKIRNCIGDLVDWYTIDSTSKRRGKWPSAVENTLRTTAKEYRTEANLANDAWQESTMAKLSEAIEAARALDAFARGYHGKPDPASLKAAGEFAAARKEIEAAMAKVLAETRVPADKGGADLKQIAQAAITRAKWGDAHRRLVVNSGRSHHEEPMSEVRIEGDWKRTWTWTEIWDEFQVCRVEEVEGDLRLVYYTIKKITQGPPWKKLGDWYVRARIVSRRILPENVEK